MLIGSVVGNVTATRKTAALQGYKFLLVQPRAPAEGGAPSALLVAVDLMGAGVGERVILATGRAALFGMGGGDLPGDAAVIGIVD